MNALYQQHVVRYLLRIRNVEQNILITFNIDSMYIALVCNESNKNNSIEIVKERVRYILL